MCSKMAKCLGLAPGRWGSNLGSTAGPGRRLGLPEPRCPHLQDGVDSDPFLIGGHGDS